MSLPRPWREILPQIVSTALIPLTVAGVGFYYTRWQQNLSDLRTMIDMVTDQATEKRKYGIAMFEYLLKNDKVPVEFITAQLDYANSSSDRDLLPLLETAIQKAAQVNSSVNDAFQEATGAAAEPDLRPHRRRLAAALHGAAARRDEGWRQGRHHRALGHSSQMVGRDA